MYLLGNTNQIHLYNLTKNFPTVQHPMAIHWASSDESLLFLTSRVKPDNELLSTALESMNTLPW